MAFHEGELEVQRRAGVAREAASLASFARREIPHAAAQFLAAQPLVIVATVARDGAIAASVLTGPRAFARATGVDAVRIAPAGGHLSRVLEDLEANADIGLLAIDFATRRRLRLNGRASRDGNAIAIATREVYSNCPQYIHPREAPSLRFDEAAPFDLVARADTFFIATAHAVAGADVSHRGGPAGFVRVDGETLSWEDYRGNNMFNTLGNLARNPNAGLLFIDFESGRSLQLRGTAHVEWNEPRRVVFSALPAKTL